MKILDACCGSRMFWFDKKIRMLHSWIIVNWKTYCVMAESW